jgi:hypothetical protein
MGEEIASIPNLYLLRSSHFLGDLMRILKTILAITLAVSTLTVPAVAQQKKTASAQAASWDGTWSGKWGGKASGRVTVKNNKVTSYYFNGRPQSVGGTKLSGKTLRFGDGYSVTMTLSGDNRADATWRGNGTAKATMTR